MVSKSCSCAVAASCFLIRLCSTDCLELAQHLRPHGLRDSINLAMAMGEAARLRLAWLLFVDGKSGETRLSTGTIIIGHRTHPHGSLADLDRVEPDDARVVALMCHIEAWASESSNQGQPETFEEAYFDFAALAQQKQVGVVLVQRSVEIVSQSLFVFLAELAQQFLQ